MGFCVSKMVLICFIWIISQNDILIIFRIQYLLNYKRTCDNLRYRYRWWTNLNYETVVNIDDVSVELENSTNTYYDAALSKHRLIMCPNSKKIICVRKESNVWRDLLFTYPVNTSGRF